MPDAGLTRVHARSGDARKYDASPWYRGVTKLAIWAQIVRHGPADFAVTVSSVDRVSMVGEATDFSAGNSDSLKGAEVERLRMIAGVRNAAESRGDEVVEVFRVGP
jgi:hypothetical protein